MKRLDRCDNKLEELNGPIIILHHPQLGENIGAAARIMANFGLKNLRIIRPRDGWPNEAATTMASGADWVIDGTEIYDHFDDAVKDLHLLFAATARLREMEKPVLNAEQAISLAMDQGESATGIVFGGESSGLPNDIVTKCDGVMTYPVGTKHPSLNLGQAVGVFAYHRAHYLTTSNPQLLDREALPTPPVASKKELEGFFLHLEEELEESGFFFPPQKTPLMKQNIRNAFGRAKLTSQEVRTMRGIVKALAKGRGPAFDRSRK